MVTAGILGGCAAPTDPGISVSGQPQIAVEDNVAETLTGPGTWQLTEPERRCVANKLADEFSATDLDDAFHWAPTGLPIRAAEMGFIQDCTDWNHEREVDVPPRAASAGAVDKAFVGASAAGLCVELRRTPGRLTTSTHSATEVAISCYPRFEQIWSQIGFEVTYPLLEGPHSEPINRIVEETVVSMFQDFLVIQEDYVCGISASNGDDPSCAEESLRRTLQESSWPETLKMDRFPGWFRLPGEVELLNDHIYSVVLPSQHQRGMSNSNSDPIAVFQFDLGAGETFELADMFRPGPDWWKPVAVAFLAVDRWRNEIRRTQDRTAPRPPLDADWWLEEIGRVDIHDPLLTYDGFVGRFSPHSEKAPPFSLGLSTITFHGGGFVFPGWCCGSDPSQLEVPYEVFEQHYDPDGPYRHIVKG
jgi:hypothetical protein